MSAASLGVVLRDAAHSIGTVDARVLLCHVLRRDSAYVAAHPEVELAFSTLFGTFGQPFFQRYHQLRPIAQGFFEERRDIYNLYPLLVHVRLFGGRYVGAVGQILRKFNF